MYNFSLLIQKASVEFSPKRNFLDDFLNGFLLLFCLLILWSLSLRVLNSLFFFEKLKTGGNFFSESKFETKLMIGGLRKCRLWYLFVELFLMKITLSEIRWKGETEDINTFSFVKVAD